MWGLSIQIGQIGKYLFHPLSMKSGGNADLKHVQKEIDGMTWCAGRRGSCWKMSKPSKGLQTLPPVNTGSYIRVILRGHGTINFISILCLLKNWRLIRS